MHHACQCQIAARRLRQCCADPVVLLLASIAAFWLCHPCASIHGHIYTAQILECEVAQGVGPWTHHQMNATHRPRSRVFIIDPVAFYYTLLVRCLRPVCIVVTQAKKLMRSYARRVGVV